MLTLGLAVAMVLAFFASETETERMNAQDLIWNHYLQELFFLVPQVGHNVDLWKYQGS